MGLRYAVALVLCLFLSISCKKTTDSETTTENPPVGTVDDTAGFYVRHITTSNYTYVTHAGDSTFSEECKAESGEDITCITEAKELDLYYNGIQIQYNIPSTLCSYVRFQPFYYFARLGGTGPTAVLTDTDSAGAVGVDPGNTGTITGPATTTCQYDYTSEIPAGPNCCEGTYTTVARTWNATTNSYDVEAPSLASWGGAISNCLLGPAMDTQTKAKNGFPRPTITYVDGTGLNATYKIAAPIENARGGNIYLANYFAAADHAGAPHAGYPAAFYPTGSIATSMYYQWECVDRSEEVIARIRLQIREWNTDAAFADMENTPTGYDVGSTEAAPFSAYDNNDFYDWKDVGSGNVFPGFDL